MSDSPAPPAELPRTRLTFGDDHLTRTNADGTALMTVPLSSITGVRHARPFEPRCLLFFGASAAAAASGVTFIDTAGARAFLVVFSLGFGLLGASGARAEVLELDLPTEPGGVLTVRCARPAGRRRRVRRGAAGPAGACVGSAPRTVRHGGRHRERSAERTLRDAAHEKTAAARGAGSLTVAVLTGTPYFAASHHQRPAGLSRSPAPNLFPSRTPVL